MSIVLEPIGIVHCPRVAPTDDDWDAVPASIQLDPQRFGPEALAGLDAFSHVEVVYQFNRVDPARLHTGARHPRGRVDWPKVGIFAQRGRERPNRLGLTICAIVRIDGLSLHVKGLDAIDGTPVLDLKPVMSGFLPRGKLREPPWALEIMAAYW